MSDASGVSEEDLLANLRDAMNRQVKLLSAQTTLSQINTVSSAVLNLAHAYALIKCPEGRTAPPTPSVDLS